MASRPCQLSQSQQHGHRLSRHRGHSSHCRPWAAAMQSGCPVQGPQHINPHEIARRCRMWLQSCDESTTGPAGREAHNVVVGGLLELEVGQVEKLGLRRMQSTHVHHELRTWATYRVRVTGSERIIPKGLQSRTRMSGQQNASLRSGKHQHSPVREAMRSLRMAHVPVKSSW